jgi:O-antigen ligase
MEMMGRDPTLTGRTEIWHLVLGLADNPLFGTGFESFWLGKRLDKVWDIYYFHLNEAHNGYIEVYLNLGWLGIAALALVMVTAYRDIVNSFRYNPDAARLRLTFLITAAAYSLTEAGFRMMNPVWISFLLAAIAVPEARVSLGATRSHTRTLQICEPSAVPVLAQEVAESVPRGLDLNHSLL